MKKKIFIAGAGGIGRACGILLLRFFGKDIRLAVADVSQEQCNEAVSWIMSAFTEPVEIDKILLSPHHPDNWNPEGDILLDCTPGIFASQFARIALRNHLHYANLTENILASRLIYDIAKNAPTAFALQTGLAPGYINQLARKCIEIFSIQYPEYKLDQVHMRVGSLSPYASSPAHYAFIWNPMGVSTEYLNESELIENHIKIIKPSLSDRESITINGLIYEADLTSGGAADLPSFFVGKVRELNYKTLRYPGHFSYIDNLKNELGDNLSKESLLQRMLKDIPYHDQDRVLIYCSVRGHDNRGRNREMIRYHEVAPMRIGGVYITAIQRATASALAQTAVLLLSDRFQGLLTQSRYPLDEFLQGSIVREQYGNFYE